MNHQTLFIIHPPRAHCTTYPSKSTHLTLRFTFDLKHIYDQYACHVGIEPQPLCSRRNTVFCVRDTYLSQVGKSNPCRRCFWNETRRGCCWEPDPPEGGSFRWSAPDTSRAVLRTFPTARRSDPTERSARPPNRQQNPAGPQSAHSHLTTKQRERTLSRHLFNTFYMQFFYRNPPKTCIENASH